MTTLILIVHVTVSLALILIVLLQTGKGAEIGASFGGSNQTIFGSRGAATFLSKITTVAATLFMITSLTLAYRASKRTSSVISDRAAPSTVPSAPTFPLEDVTEIPAAPVPETPESPALE